MPQQKKPFAVVRALMIVLQTFTGIQRGATHRNAAAGLKPRHFIIAGVIAALLLVFALISLVRSIAS